MSITRLIATYRLTTPMFCSGADPHAAELRAASFKGVLRFWYRAVALGAHNGDVNKVHSAEAKLFGSTKEGQAKVLMSMKVLGSVREIPERTQVEDGFAYLAGQGLAKYIKEDRCVRTQRPAIAAGTRLQVTCLFRSHDENDLESVRKSLLAVGLLGGLGSRTRRGLGSLTLEKFDRALDKSIEESWTLDNVSKTLRSFFPTPPMSSEGLAYTAISSDTRFLLLPGNAKETAGELLERVGRAFLHYRSYGRNGKAAGTNALQWFRRDHDEMLNVTQRQAKDAQHVVAPERAVFGLPHNYFFSSLGRPKGIVEIQGHQEQRRASPLFIHMHQLAEGPPMAILAFLPAEFLPSMALDVENQGKIIPHVPLARPPELWQPIHEFFEEIRQGNRSHLAVKFPGALEVKP